MLKHFIELAKKHKAIIYACMVALCVAAVLACFFICFMPQAYGKMQSEYISDNYSIPTSELNVADKLTQSFTYDKPIYALGFVVDSLNSKSGDISLEIYDSESNLLGEGTNFNVTDMNIERYTVIKLDKPAVSKSGEYTAVITINTSNGALLYKSEFALSLSELIEKEKPVNGTLAMLASYSIINDLFVNVFFVFISICIVSICVLVFWLVFVKKIRVEKLFVVCLFTLGFLYNIILPPYSSPDEVFHINEAYSVSNSILGVKGDLYSNISIRSQDQNIVIEDKETSLYAYKEFASGLFEYDNSTLIQAERTQVGGLRALYWASGAGVAIARSLNMGYVPLLYLGRLANLIVFAICGYFAIKCIPVAKSLVLAILLLPISLHVGFSFSRDSIILSLATLFICLCIEHIITGKALQWKRACVILLCALFIVASKSGVYIPILLLVFFIPQNCFKDNKHHLGFKFGIAIICAVFFVSTTMDIAVANATSGAKASSSPEQIVQDLEKRDSRTFNLYYINTHTRQTATIILNTALQNTDFYLSSMVGGSLGYFSININNIFVAALWMILLALSANGSDLAIKKRHRFGFGLIFFAVAGLVVAGCLLWTPVYYTEIYGIQGRYILPALLLLGVALQSKKVQISALLESAIVYSLVPINLLILLNAFSVIVSR